jgi:LPXTG-site transpeptidase (sortase) family protein
LRDLLVFLILFLLGLAVWTTGLFPVVQVQAIPLVQTEDGQETGAAAHSTGPQPSDTEEQAPLPEVTLALPEQVKDNQEASRSEVPPKTGTKERSQNEPENQIQDEPVIERILIPSLKVDAQVVDVPFNGVTWDISTLGQDIARLGEIPGESAGENIVLAGHFSVGWTELGPFRYISRLALGAPILVYTDRMIYTYQVREHAVVGDQDDRVIAQTSEPQLTLLTCETWDEKTGKFLRRRVVFADLVRREPLGHPTIQ